jgi:hypothetical protein
LMPASAPLNCWRLGGPGVTPLTHGFWGPMLMCGWVDFHRKETLTCKVPLLEDRCLIYSEKHPECG